MGMFLKRLRLFSTAALVMMIMGCGGGGTDPINRYDLVTINSSNEESLAIAATEGAKQAIISDKINPRLLGGNGSTVYPNFTRTLAGINKSIYLNVHCTVIGLYSRRYTACNFQSSGIGIDGRAYSVHGNYSDGYTDDFTYGDDASGYFIVRGYVVDLDPRRIRFYGGPIFFDCNNGQPSSGSLNIRTGDPNSPAFGTNWVDVTVTYNDCTSFTVSYSGRSTTYSYSSIDAIGVPTDVSIDETTNDSAVISWNPVMGATSYNIYYASSADVSISNGNKLSDATSPQTIKGLTNGVTYYFVVTAKYPWGESIESLGVMATLSLPL